MVILSQAMSFSGLGNHESEGPGMVTWNQVWHGYWTWYGLPLDNIFVRMAVPPGWMAERELLFMGWTLHFVYPACNGPGPHRDALIL